MKLHFFTILMVLGATPVSTAEQMPHPHQTQHKSEACDGALACATTATPYFAPDGKLWLAWADDKHVLVSSSTDLGHTFSNPVQIAREGEQIDEGADARPQLVVTRQGRVIVTYAVFKDANYNGQVRYAQSDDGGMHFTASQPITSDNASQRFQYVALDVEGGIFGVWLDKRTQRAARDKQIAHPGAALAYAWWDAKKGLFGDDRIAVDNTCECCRLGVTFATPGRPIVAFRNIFDTNTRDHAIIRFTSSDLPGPVLRVSDDGWNIDACPHQGPSLALSATGRIHVAWYTNGDKRKGLFYAHITGRDAFSPPLALGNPENALSRPYLLSTANTLWAVWKEFDGQQSSVVLVQSKDDGETWSMTRQIASTTDASDHPILTSDGTTAYLSWLTKREGYRLMPLEAKP